MTWTRFSARTGLVSYRAKTIDTVLGPVTLRRAWYHCASCGHGVVPKDDELGVGQESMSPGTNNCVECRRRVFEEAGCRVVRWAAALES